MKQVENDASIMDKYIRVKCIVIEWMKAFYSPNPWVTAEKIEIADSSNSIWEIRAKTRNSPSDFFTLSFTPSPLQPINQ